MRHWGAERRLNGAEIGALCFKKRVEKGKKKNTQGFGVSAAGSAGGAVQDPHLSKARWCHLLQQSPPHRLLPGAASEAIQARGYLVKTPPKKQSLGFWPLRCSAVGQEAKSGRGGRVMKGQDGRTNGQTEMVRACKKSLLEREAGRG